MPITLETITLEDIPLYESSYCDPRMMEHLGGAWPKERIPQKLRQDIELIESGKSWTFKIIPDENDNTVAGSVCLWDHSRNGETITEVGWMVLSPFQRRGLASEAVRAILDKARAEARCKIVHAFPGTLNVPSNAICKKMGFTLIGECDLEYAGTLLRCNHWRLGLGVDGAR
ncbi:MAG: hypothetical protein QOJ64_3178 [Acidobacteriota bacterium]|jgi:RimJ/RimL family protein N-acetyltransferase|nr:hypothetical protein [Acidobacteriota bacterium]